MFLRIAFHPQLVLKTIRARTFSRGVRGVNQRSAIGRQGFSDQLPAPEEELKVAAADNLTPDWLSTEIVCYPFG